MARGSRNSGGVAGFATIPAPTGGWNTSLDWSAMSEKDAIQLQNYIPKRNHIELRKGYASHATGLSGAVDTLMEYRAGTTNQLLAADRTGGDIFNVTSSGAVGAAVSTGNSESKWQYQNYGGLLIAVNGTDSPAKWDGSTWATNAWTGSGLTDENLIGINIYKERVYLIEKNTASVWYGGSQSTSGATTEFDLQYVARTGGNLMAMGTLTVDGGSGIDDLACFIMDSGTVLIYSGLYPGDSGWSLVGQFRMGRPIGRRCLVDFGPDLIVITEDGYQSLLEEYQKGRVAVSSESPGLSGKIAGAVLDAAGTYYDTFGWQACLYPKESMMVFNVPNSSTGMDQHVLNTITGAWCRWTGISPAYSWCLLDNDLYIGGDGEVFKYSGTDDDGSNIEGIVQTSFQHPGGGNIKRFTQLQTLIGSNADVDGTVYVEVDYANGTDVFTTSTVTVGGAVWDVAPWDTSEWSADFALSRDWNAIAAIGRAVSIRFQSSTKVHEIRYNHATLQYERGKGI